MKRSYKVEVSVWVYPGKAGWHFVNIPKETSENIDFYFHHAKRGWGSLPVEVTVGNANWKTSIFPEKKSGTYLLPLKSEIRKNEEIKEGDKISIRLEIES
jgi:hypothetical protein